MATPAPSTYAHARAHTHTRTGGERYLLSPGRPGPLLLLHPLDSSSPLSLLLLLPSFSGSLPRYVPSVSRLLVPLPSLPVHPSGFTSDRIGPGSRADGAVWTDACVRTSRSLLHLPRLSLASSRLPLRPPPRRRSCCCSYVTEIPRGIASHHVTVRARGAAPARSARRCRGAPCSCAGGSLRMPVQAELDRSLGRWVSARRRTGTTKRGRCARELCICCTASLSLSLSLTDTYTQMRYYYVPSLL